MLLKKSDNNDELQFVVICIFPLKNNNNEMMRMNLQFIINIYFKKIKNKQEQMTTTMNYTCGCYQIASKFSNKDEGG
jgi:hypothetical protein